MVYLPMSFIYGKRFTGKITELVKQLREEIFVQKYSEINWDEARNLCAKVCSHVIAYNYQVVTRTIYDQKLFMQSR
jgi:hypothetical protein